MKKKEVKTKFNFPYSTLKQNADNLLQLLDRDLVEHTDRGFTPDKRTAIVNLIDAFDSLPDDEQLLGMRETATQNKDAARVNLEKQMRTIFLAAKNVFSEDSGKYREFGNADLSRQTDDELIRNAKMMTATATKYLNELADEGITEAKITQFKSLKTILDDSIDMQKRAISDKDTGAEARIEAANALYDTLVKYSDIGKDIWSAVNEAKYNDYVIYNTASGTVENNALVDPPVTPA